MIEQGSDIYIGFRNADSDPSPALPAQETLLKSRQKHVLAAGSLGWGKTDWLVVQVIIEAMSFKNNLIVLGRKTLAALKKSTLISLFDIIDHRLILKHDKQDQCITFINNSKVFYMQLDESREAVQKVKSMNIGAVFVDQIEEISENTWIACIGQLRRKNASRRSFATANPAGHDWVWKRFVKKGGMNENYFLVEGKIWREDVPPPTKQSDVKPIYCDNSNLTWDYIVDRLAQPERWVKRFVFGSWDNYEGLVWDMFDEKVHGIKPFEIPHWWNRYVVLDHGHRNPTAVGFFAVSGDGDVYLYDLHYQAGEWVDHHAGAIWSKIGEDQITRFLADPSIFHNRGGLATDTTIAGQYEEYGLFWDSAMNDVNGGLDRVARYLKADAMTGTPKFYYFNTPQVEPFVEEMQNYRWDDKEGVKTALTEKPIKKHDHACDVLRYFINYMDESVEPLPINRSPQWLKGKQSTNSWKVI
jgi:PBSX family phage terminase large subunit